jgi:RNA polymerase-interacting CarD/CdnL/TRCF family regulator
LARPAAAGGDDTKQRAIVRTLISLAVGNLRAISVLVAVLARMQGPKDESAEQLSDHDREILEKFAQRELRIAEESEATDVANEKGGHPGRVP